MPVRLFAAVAVAEADSLVPVLAGVLSAVLSAEPETLSLSGALLLSTAALLAAVLWETEAAVGTESAEPHAASPSTKSSAAAREVNFFIMIHPFRFILLSV